MVVVEEKSLDPESYLLCTFEDRKVTTGADQDEVQVPAVPLPVRNEFLLGKVEVTDSQIGESVYDYLRRFPNCSLNMVYARFLADAYSHYIADMSSQILMIEHKDVDSPYVQRQLSMLKILLLLDEKNSALLYQLGHGYFQLGMMYSELQMARNHLMVAVDYLKKGKSLSPDDMRINNLLAQINYLHGDYPVAKVFWQQVIKGLPAGDSREILNQRIERIDRQEVPDYPILDDLEQIGYALELYADGFLQEAKNLMEILEEKAVLTAELPNPDFFVLLGKLREECDDQAGAFESFEKALELDPESAEAISGRDRIVH